jgi:hypothetical protein
MDAELKSAGVSVCCLLASGFVWLQAGLLGGCVFVSGGCSRLGLGCSVALPPTPSPYIKQAKAGSTSN